MACAAQGEIGAVVGNVVTDIQFLQVCDGVFVGDAHAIRLAIQRPVVEDGEGFVGCQVNVQFDNVGAVFKCGLHRGDGVFDEVVSDWFDVWSAAGIGGAIVTRINMVDAAMGDQFCAACGGGEQGCVVGPDCGGD